ncbi:MAG: restriction endonuclease subunit S [Methylothermaceae bacterium]|nr:restriction endonuclease subunit S [Methylothermaceae bacterium]
MRLNAGIDVPDLWQFLPLKRITRFGYGDALASDAREKGGIKVYGSNGPFDEHSEANTLGPCIVVGRKGSYGKFNYSDYPVFAVDTTFIIDRRHTDADLRFLYYLLSILGLDELSDDTAVPGLSRQKAYQALCPLPPLDIQRRIARFLDEKTARIDGLIEKKRALLDRLGEKRQALITRAVTKGLNPGAPMKPSGIDWLGDIPAHWEVKRLRFLLDRGTLNGLYKAKEAFDPDGIPFVQMGEAFRSPVFDGGTEDRVIASNEEVEKWGLMDGDFLIARRSIVFEGSGKSVLVSGLREPHIFESSMIRIRPKEPADYSRFLSFYFQSQIGRESILSVTKRVTISGIDSQQLKSIHVPVPPGSESRDIATYCESYDRNAGHVESEISASIERLTEYRAALITAAVSGKMEIA